MSPRTYNVLLFCTGNSAQSILERRLKLFLALPLASPDRLAIQHHVDSIGRLHSDIAEDRAS